MYLYEKLIEKYIDNKLDKDTKSIVKKYSIFYLKNDYIKITDYIKKETNKIKGFFDFIILNNFHLYIFKKCDELIFSIDYLKNNLSLEDIMLLIKENIKKLSKSNFTITLFINKLYMEPPGDFDFPSNIEKLFFKSQEYIIKILKKINMTEEEIKDYLSYLYENFKDIINEKNLKNIYKNYKNDFSKYIHLI